LITCIVFKPIPTVGGYLNDMLTYRFTGGHITVIHKLFPLHQYSPHSPHVNYTLCYGKCLIFQVHMHHHTHTHTQTVQSSALHGAQVVLIMQVCIKTMFMLFLDAENNKLENVLVCMAHQFLHICSTVSSIFSNS